MNRLEQPTRLRRGEMFSRLQLTFLGSYSHRQRVVGLSSGRLELEEPGAVDELVFGVQFGVVARAALPHPPEDLEPALAQAAQRAGMGLTAIARGFVIDLRPRAMLPAQVRPEMDVERSTVLQSQRMRALRSCPDWKLIGAVPA